MNVVYVTGNENKARLFNKMVGVELEHTRIDTEEIQSLDIREVIEHKARAAYAKINRPVIVEDTFVIFKALGGLPGPFIKWFLEELGTEGICRMLDGKDRSAVAGAAIAYYDGNSLEIFIKELAGRIAEEPQGDSGFGWNEVFMPENSELSLGQMTAQDFERVYKKIKPFDELRHFLDRLDDRQA